MRIAFDILQSFRKFLKDLYRARAAIGIAGLNGAMVWIMVPTVDNSYGTIADRITHVSQPPEFESGSQPCATARLPG